jgi:hypothetical protein
VEKKRGEGVGEVYRRFARAGWERSWSRRILVAVGLPAGGVDLGWCGRFLVIVYKSRGAAVAGVKRCRLGVQVHWVQPWRRGTAGCRGDTNAGLGLS